MNSDWPDTRPPRSLYLHVPFCRHRCGYCNFTLVAGRDYLIDRFVDAAIAEMERDLAARNESLPPLETLYLGGGTPTHLAGPPLDRLFHAVHSRFQTDPAVECTVEANPADITAEVAEQLVRIGVNRISLGVQSLSGEKLRLLERDHDAEVVKSSIELARQNFGSHSMDMIFATPGETIQKWEQDLRAALELVPDHLSAYELTWEKGTSYWSRKTHGQWQVADEGLRADMYAATIDICREHGLEQYEISSFARSPSHRSSHNRMYWTGSPWMAFGPGAASFENGVRTIRHRSVLQYLKMVEAGDAVWETDSIPLVQRVAEILCIGLRMVEGVRADEFKTATGLDLASVAPKMIGEFMDLGLAETTPHGLRLTFRGLVFHDSISQKIMAAAGR